MDETRVHWVGIDVAKNSFDAAVVFCGQHYPHTPLREVPAVSFARTPEGARQFVHWLDTQTAANAGQGSTVRVVMESTGDYSVKLTAWLTASRKTLQPAIVNPHRTSCFLKSLGLRNKTDRVEARGLAFYGAERRPAPYEPLAPARAKLRELNRFRDALVSQRVAETNREENAPLDKTVRRVAARRLRQLGRDINTIEQKMREVIETTPRLKHDHDLLITIPGVAFLTACTILAELGDLRRFQRARQLSAFAGVSPRVCQSGTSVYARPRMSKAGNARIRQALYMSAITAASMTGPLKNNYDRLVSSGKKPKAARGVVMRKLLVLMRAVLLFNTPYDRQHQNCGKSTAYSA